MTDDDYIPFEGPLHRSRGRRQLSDAEVEKLMESARRIRERQAERTREREALCQMKSPTTRG
jgi:hypothetical protein